MRPRLIWAITGWWIWFVVAGAMTLPPVRVTVKPPIAHATVPIELTIFVRRHPLNRVVRIEVASAAYYSSSDVPLEGLDSDPLFLYRTFRHLPAGAYDAVAQVYRVRQSPAPSVTSFVVLE